MKNYLHYFYIITFNFIKPIISILYKLNNDRQRSVGQLSFLCLVIAFILIMGLQPARTRHCVVLIARQYHSWDLILVTLGWGQNYQNLSIHQTVNYHNVAYNIFPTAQIKGKLIFLRDNGYNTFEYLKHFYMVIIYMRLFNFQLRILNNRVQYLAVKCSTTFALKNGIKLIAKIPKTYNPTPRNLFIFVGFTYIDSFKKVQSLSSLSSHLLY